MTSTVFVYDAPPSAPQPKVLQPSSAFWSEWQVGFQLLRLGLSSLELRTIPKGHGQPVMLLPGFLAPEWSMEPLRRYLNWLGYSAIHWGLGVNRGNPERDHALLAPKVAKLAQQAGQPVTLIGWSLGGVVAREVARIHPESVAQVISYGTPVIGGPTYTIGARTYGEEECQRIASLIDELDKDSPIEVPITAIFTRNDATVSWPACIDRQSKNVVHIEVKSSHGSMGVDPDVWRIVGEKLNQNLN
ncbi:MAG: alpha/beta hydrolase [Chloroflexota bacterium]